MENSITSPTACCSNSSNSSPNESPKSDVNVRHASDSTTSPTSNSSSQVLKMKRKSASDEKCASKFCSTTKKQCCSLAAVGQQHTLKFFDTVEQHDNYCCNNKHLELCQQQEKEPEIENPKIETWLKQMQTFTNYEKNVALSLLVSKFCNTSQRRLIRTIVEPFFQKDFSNPEVIPKEMVMKILSFLSAKDLLNISSTSRALRQLAEDWTLWKEKCPDWLDWFKTDLAAQSSCVLTPSTPGRLAKLSNRCPPKAAYLRREKINSNWRKARPRRQIVLRGHDDHVITCLQICNDDIIVSGSDDNTLKIWSIASVNCLHTLVGHTGGVWCSQVTSDGQLIVSGSTDRTVRVWETSTGQCLFTLLGHTSTVRCMALKGDILISGSRDSTLRAWNVRTGHCLHVFTGHVAAVRCVQFDGKRAVSGAYDFMIRVWDVERRVCLHTLVGHTNRVYSLQFDSVRNIVVSGSLDTSIRVWNINTGLCLFTLMGHQSLTSGMQLNGHILVSGNADSTLKIWDIETGRCLHTLSGASKHTSAVTSLQVLPNYNLIATSSDDGSVKLWDSSSGHFLTDLTKLTSGGSGGCIWRLRATPTMLICAVGSRNGTEDTKLLVYDFDADCP